MKRIAFLSLFLFVSSLLFSSESMVGFTGAIQTGERAEANTTLVLDTSSPEVQYIEVGFSEEELRNGDFSSSLVKTDLTFLSLNNDGRASNTIPIYIYYRIHYIGPVSISIEPGTLQNERLPEHMISVEVSGERADDGTAFFTGDEMEDATLYHQDGIEFPVADSVLLEIETEDLRDKPSGVYRGVITLKVDTDEGVEVR